MRGYILISLFLMSSSPAYAATIYLDGGIGQTSCTNYLVSTRSCGGGTEKAYSLPWDAAAALATGDKLYIRQGNYYQNVTGKPGYQWYMGALNIGSSNIWVENYMGEEVWLQSGPDHTGIGLDDTNNALGLGGTNNTINGINYNLKIWGGTVLGGTGNTIQGCDLSGGWDHEAPYGTANAAFPNVVRVFFSTGATIRNCKLHDNKSAGAGNSSNLALIMHTEDQDTTVENCYFYNPLGSLMYVKHQSASGIVEMTYRYNLFEGGVGFDYPDTFKNKYIFVYQNIFKNTKLGNSRHNVSNDYVKVYNNIYYNVERVLYDWKPGSLGNWISFFNNIIYCDSYGTANVYYDAATDFQVLSDYNLYFRTGVGYTWKHGTNATQTSLAGWRSMSGLDIHSVEQDPGFLNASGSFSQPSDFKRKSYPLNGIGGQYPTVMGAFINGTEVIGLTGKYIYPPRNLRIQ